MNTQDELLTETQNAFQNYENSMYRLVQYMVHNQIFNTYVTNVDEDNEFSIILTTKNPKLNDLLSHLNKHTIIKKDDEILNETCPICFDEYKIKQHKRALDKCSHYFHKKCIDKWFRKNKSQMNCPICRTNYNKKIEL